VEETNKTPPEKSSPQIARSPEPAFYRQFPTQQHYLGRRNTPAGLGRI